MKIKNLLKRLPKISKRCKYNVKRKTTLAKKSQQENEGNNQKGENLDNYGVWKIKATLKKGEMFGKNILCNTKYQNEMLKLTVKNSFL